MKKNIFKIVSVVGAVVMASAFGAACTKDDGPSDGDTNKKVTLNVWCTSEDSTLTQTLCEQWLALDENSGKSIELLYGTCSEAEAATTVSADAKNSADIFAFASDQLNTLAQVGALASYKDTGSDECYYRKIVAANTASSISSATVSFKANKTDAEVNKGLQAFPMSSDNTYFLYYNKKELTATDVTTLKGIVSKCSATKQFAYPLNDGWYDCGFFFAMGDNISYQEYLDANSMKTIARDVNFDNEYGLAACQAIYDLTAGYDNADGYRAVLSDADDSKIKTGFKNKSLIAAVSGSWNAVDIKKSLGEDYAVAELPSFEATINSETKSYPLGAFLGHKLIGVNANTANINEASSLALYLTNENAQVERYKARNIIPTNTNALNNAEVSADPIAQTIANRLDTKIYRTQRNVPSSIWNAVKAVGTTSYSILSTGKGSFVASEQVTTVQSGIQGDVKTSAVVFGG